MQICLILLVGAVTRCRCDPTTAYSNNVNGASHFGELLKPPPPPLSPILPVPFHGGAGRSQRQNVDVGYQYQQPPPPSPSINQIPQFSLPTDFKFPAPFYKQYKFNFVPPPQPFTTTPPPSLFQKVSTWLFPSQQTSYDAESAFSNTAPIKKDCNPCNLVPWIPVIRYNLGAKNVHQNNNPTYGPPSPTAQPQHVAQFQPQPFQHQNNELISIPQLRPGVPHAVYGLPNQAFNSNSVSVISSTYGPPSPTHTIGIASQSPISSTYTSSYSSIPSSTYGGPSSSIRHPSSSFLPSYSQGVSVTSYNVPSSTYGPPTLLYTTPSPSYNVPLPVTTYGPPVTNYDPGVLNNNLQPQGDVEILNDHDPSTEQKLPKVSQPTEFRNSYGEIITNTYALDIPYPVSATAAESTKIKTEVLPNGNPKPEGPNMSMALANPAPFTLNRGRNIHTLQPVALPNLSVSPLPPIFNARPFRPIPSPFPSNILQGINQMQLKPNNVDIEQSVPLVEFTHSIDYPATYVQSPVIDIDDLKINNQTKAFRNIPNHFVIDEIRDISSQASEDHVSATKSIPDSSFESTGPEVGNDLYDNGIATELKMSSNVPLNHKTNFGDLRGVKDEDVDKYRTESNLQNIDSPLLYLKPSAPHKNYGNFIFAVSTPINDNEYEMYDDIPSTVAPPTLPSAWDESRTDYSETIQPPPVNTYQPKIVQIIVPYTTITKEEQNVSDKNHSQQDWSDTSDETHIGRKAPSNSESPYSTLVDNYSTLATTTDDPNPTESYDSESERIHSATILNDLYDVKEPPFDIVKLQHTIDDWTEKEYSKYKPLQRPRNGEKHSKKIPDEYFTTTQPINFVTQTSNYYDFYDHEGSSSNQHTVTENESTFKPRKEYNNIERTKSRFISSKNEEADEIDKLHIYTAASSFRTSTSSTTTTTPAPWGKIQTSISPLTKEKVYVVTSKPWRGTPNVTKDWYELESFESKKTNVDVDSSSDNLPFKPPRFMHRPSFGFTSGGKIESVKSDSSYGFSRSWYQSSKFLENILKSIISSRFQYGNYKLD